MREPRIYKNEKGDTEVTLAFSEKLKDELCDFCARLNPPYKIYPCKDFQHPMSPLHWSRGDWNACVTCSRLIDEDDREELLKRCLLMSAMEYGSEDMEIKEIITRSFHNGFFANRKDK